MEIYLFKSLYEVFIIVLNIKSIILGNYLEVGDGEGIQEVDEVQVFGLRYQFGYSGWKCKYKRRDSLEGGYTFVLDMFVVIFNRYF